MPRADLVIGDNPAIILAETPGTWNGNSTIISGNYQLPAIASSYYNYRYKFTGWTKWSTSGGTSAKSNTTPSISGTSFSANALFNVGDTVTGTSYWNDVFTYYLITEITTGKRYTINYNGSGGSTPNATYADYPSKVSVAGASSWANYIFQRWNTSTNNNGTTYNASTEINHPGEGSVTVYAIWTGVTYTFSYNGNTNTGGSNSNTSADYPTDIDIADNGFTKTGYVFSNWNSLANNTGDKRTPGKLAHPGSGSSTLYAQWTPAVYVLSYEGNGNTNTGGTTSVAPANTNLTYNSANTVAANGATNFVKTGWTFTKWQINNASGTKVTDVLSGSSTIVWADTDAPFKAQAQWSVNVFTLSYDGNGYTSGSTANSTSEYPNSATVRSNGFSKNGYYFSGWSTTSGGGVNYQPASTISHPTAVTTTTLYAVWTGWTYTLKYYVNTATGGGGSTENTSARHPTAVSVASNTFTKTGYNFAGWATSADGSVAYQAGNSYTNPVGTDDNGSANLFAKWTAASYTITYNANAVVTGSTTSSSPTYDSSFTFRANGFTRIGYTFREWNLREGTTTTISTPQGTNIGNYASSASYGTWNKALNCTAFAIWDAITYTITYNGNSIDPTGNVTGSTTTSSFLFDSTFTFPANGFTLIGFTFSGWNLKNNGVPVGGIYNAGATYGVWKIPNNCTADAMWTINSYAVTFDRNGKGVGKSVTQNYKTIVTCPTLKAVGYVFGGWATSVQNATNKIVNKVGNAQFTLGAAAENYFAIWTDNTNNTVSFSELETVFGVKGTSPISISEYRAESGQTTANSIITVSTHFKGKGVAPP